MDNYERSKIADSIKEHDFAKGEKVIQQGEDGSIFFLIISGEAYATKVVKEGEQATEVKTYKSGDYFGELALLKNAQRAASVFART